MAERTGGVARRVAWSATLTVVSLSMFETLAQLGGWLPEPVGLLALIVASCAFVGGSQGGLASAALCVVFAIIAGPLGSRMFPLDPRHFARASIAAYALPALALLVGSLRIQAQNRLGRYRLARAEADSADQRYRELIEGLGGVCWQVGLPDHEVQSVSRNAADLFGYGLTRWLDGSSIWKEIVHPDDLDRVLATFGAAARAERPVDISHRVVTATGEVTHVRSVVQSRTDDAGAVVSLQGVTLTATTLGAELADRVGRAVFADLPDPVFVLDPDGHIVDVNPAACAALGYTRDELLRLDLAGIGLDRLIPGGDAAAVPAVLRGRDGRDVSLTLRVLPLAREAGPLTVVYGAVRGAAA